MKETFVNVVWNMLKVNVFIPFRTSTTTVKVVNGDPLPVRSAEPLPKSLIFDCMAVLRTVSVAAPVSAGTVIVKNICNTGIDMIATADAGENHLN